VADVLIAIDGPAGAGKSTVARAVARALGWTFLDSGAMYRCEALADLRGQAPPQRIELGDRVILDGEDVTVAIRAAEVSERASVVAGDPAVRARLVAMQRELIADGDWVAEGRDIGTVVAPEAEVKVFLTASDDERARRRAAEVGLPIDEVLAQQRARDARDSEREHSPLRRATDAVELDTTGLTVEQVVDRISALVPV
jgi:CMP/dCMP kinase